MTRTIILSVALATLALPVQAATTYHYSSAYSVGDLIDNPATKAILDNRIPGFTNAPQIPQIRGTALSTVESAPDAGISMATRKQIDDDLAAIPATAPPK